VEAIQHVRHRLGWHHTWGRRHQNKDMTPPQLRRIVNDVEYANPAKPGHDDIEDDNQRLHTLCEREQGLLAIGCLADEVPGRAQLWHQHPAKGPPIIYPQPMRHRRALPSCLPFPAQAAFAARQACCVIVTTGRVVPSLDTQTIPTASWRQFWCMPTQSLPLRKE